MKRMVSTANDRKLAVTAAKDMSRGIFWVIDDALYAFPFIETLDTGLAKSGNTYNHKKLWNYVRPKKCNKPFDYYPRGRVEISNKGKPIIYMNPNIDESYLPEIRTQFGLRTEPTIRYDYSDHYKCYLDEGYSSSKR